MTTILNLLLSANLKTIILIMLIVAALILFLTIMKLIAQVEVQRVWADAFSKYTRSVVPQLQTGGGPKQTERSTSWIS